MGTKDSSIVVGEGEGWWREDRGAVEIGLIVEPNGIV
jgi:hypothetical protein